MAKRTTRTKTDSIKIGSRLKSYENPLFAWAVSQIVGGKDVNLNGQYQQFTIKEKQILKKLKETNAPDAVIEKFQEDLTEQQIKTFNQLLQIVYDPTAVASMADARKLVDKIRFAWRIGSPMEWSLKR